MKIDAKGTTFGHTTELTIKINKNFKSWLNSEYTELEEMIESIPQ